MRKLLFIHVKNTIATIKLIPPFQELKKILEEKNLIKPGVDVDRYTAMVKSFVNGNTIDEDVRWH